MHFMSIEVAAQEFLFTPSDTTDDSSDFDEQLSATEWDEEMAEIDVPFSHNHLHDLESLWWVAVWEVFNNCFSEGTTRRDRFTLQDVKDQLGLAEKLFPPVPNNTARQNGFKITKSFRKTCNQLPHDKKVACISLNVLRKHLIRHYKAIEAGYPLINPNASTDDIYDAFTQSFTTLKSKYHGFALKPIQDIYEELSKPETKRPRSESTNDTRVAQKNARK